MATESQLISFINKIQADDTLKRKIIAAEKTASTEATALAHRVEALRAHNLEAIKAIAKEAGFDIVPDIGRPEALDVAPHDHDKEDLGDCCHLTCCWVETSAVARQ
jgi:hypothetical protein